MRRVRHLVQSTFSSSIVSTFSPGYTGTTIKAHPRTADPFIPKIRVSFHPISFTRRVVGMWRSFATRALLHSRGNVLKLRHPAIDVGIPQYEAAIPALHSVHSVFSRSSHFHRHARFFSTDSVESNQENSFEAVILDSNDAADGFGHVQDNVFDDITNSGFENDDSMFDGATDDLEGNESSAKDFESSVDMNGCLDSLEVEDTEVSGAHEKDREVVESLLSLLQSTGTVDGPLEPHLDAMGLVLDQELVLEVLATPQVPGEKLIVFFVWVLEKPGFEVTTAVLDALVSVICSENRIKQAYALWNLVKEICVKKKVILSTRSLNEIIATFSRLGKAKVAFDVFNSFEEFGCTTTGDTYYLTIEAVCRRSFYEWACLVCEKMLNADKLPEFKRIEKIIYYLCKGGMMKDAHLVYLYAKDKKIYLSRSSIIYLVNSFSRIEKADRGTNGGINKEHDKTSVSMALELLNEFSVEDRKYATKSFSKVVKKLCWIEDVQRAKDLVLEMISSGPPPGNDAFNPVINGLSKAGDMEEALNMMKLMKSRGLKPDVYTYSVVMSGYVKAGEMEKACAIFDEAKRNHSKLTPVTFHTLIRGFCKLEQFDKAVNLLGEMKQYGVQPNHDEYNKLIKSLCFKALDWETAEKLREEMKSSGVILNGRTSGLIEAVKELKPRANSEA